MRVVRKSKAMGVFDNPAIAKNHLQEIIPLGITSHSVNPIIYLRNMLKINFTFLSLCGFEGFFKGRKKVTAELKSALEQALRYTRMHDVRRVEPLFTYSFMTVMY